MNERIKQISTMVDKGLILADIGTDHAQLPIILVSENICDKVYACDVAEGPLRSAKENISHFGLSDKITTILSNGLDKVPSDTNGIVIAGMGYITATMILENGINRLNDFKQIIVQINRDTTDMRKWISEHEYTITNECYIHEKGHDYVSIAFNTNYHEKYNDSDILLGPILKERREEEYLEYCNKQLTKINTILDKSNGKAPHSERLLKEKKIYENYL